MTEKSTVLETKKKGSSEFSTPFPVGCNHEWRIVPNFFDESRGRDIRTYVFYCVRCLKSKTATMSRLR